MERSLYRAVSIILCLAVVLTLLPAATFAAQVTGLELLSDPVLTGYFTHDTLDLSAVRLKVTDSDGATTEITGEECTASSCDMSTAGKKELTLSYGGKTVTLEVQVHDRYFVALQEYEYRFPDFDEDIGHAFASGCDCHRGDPTGFDTEDTQTLTVPKATQIQITLEKFYFGCPDGHYGDQLQGSLSILDRNGNVIAEYTENFSTPVQLTIRGDTVTVRLDVRCPGCGLTEIEYATSNIQADIGTLHEGTTVVEDRAPTCTEEGFSSGKVCDICDGYFDKENTTPALKHDYVSGTCTRCGDTVTFFLIGNADQLYEFQERVNNGERTLNGKLVNDIIVNEQLLNEYGYVDYGADPRGWSPIGIEYGAYDGLFDGDGHTIWGLYRGSLFGHVGTQAQIKDLHISDSRATELQTSGMLAAVNRGTIEDCSVDATVGRDTAPDNICCDIGGAVGINYGTLINIRNSGMIFGTERIGGIVGYNYGTVFGCSNEGSIIGSNYEADTYVDEVGDISSLWIGGIAGWNEGIIDSSFNTGNVFSSSHQGGIFAGLAGHNTGTIIHCYNAGSISSDRYVAGGLVGEDEGGTIQDCYNTGNVSGHTGVGGLVGRSTDTTLTDCYNTGTICGQYYDEIGYDYGVDPSDVGPILGSYDNTTVSSCYYLKNCAKMVLGMEFVDENGQYTDVTYDCTMAGTEMSDDDFTGGKVACLLGAPFGQNIDNDGPIQDAPVFSDALVYRVTDCLGSGTYYSNSDSVIHQYSATEGLCSKCGGKCAHSYEKTVLSPTCTEQGYTQYRCVSCGYSYSIDYVDALGHDYRQSVTAPTCTAQGYTTHTCSACGDSYVDSYVDKLSHNYSSTVTAPTCTAQGYTTHTCTDCGDSYQDAYIDALPHAYDSTVTAPTCTARGYTTYTCTVCGDSYKDTYVDKLPHDYQSVVKAPTCSAEGYTTHTCTVCGDGYTDSYVDMLPHDYQSVVTAPTCGAQGCTTHTCKSCGHSYSDAYTAALGHTYPPDGVCTRCGGRNTIHIYMSDSYGDGWNGNGVQVYEDGVLIGTATFTDGSSSVWSVACSAAHNYTFKWVKAAYSNECSFDIRLDEVTQFSATTANCNAFTNGELVHTMAFPCTHSWRAADCASPRTCVYCGETEGEALGHNFNVITGLCARCGGASPFEVEAPQMEYCYTNKQTSVRAKWTKVEGVDGYELYRSTDPDDLSSFKVVKSITNPGTTTYTNSDLTEGVTYYYRVCAYVLMEDGKTRVRSPLSEAKHIPAAVVWNAPYSNSSFRIRLRWAEVDGCHGYQIWRKSADEEYRVVKTVGDRGNTLTNDQGGTTAYSNVNLTAGETYTYKMRAFYINSDGTKTYGPYSDEVTVAVQPIAPQITATSPKAGRAKIQWEAANGATGYQVWMSESPDTGFKITKTITDGDTTSYTKSSLDSGKTYYFKIRAFVEVNDKKTFGAYSETIAVKVQ